MLINNHFGGAVPYKIPHGDSLASIAAHNSKALCSAHVCESHGPKSSRRAN